MERNMKKLSLSILAIVAGVIVVSDCALAKRGGRDRERREHVDTVRFDYYRYSDENKMDCRSYRRYEDDRCNSYKYECSSCKRSRHGDGTYSYRVFRLREREREHSSVWIRAGVARGTGSWENRIMPRGWPKCGAIRNGQRDTLNRICRDAGYGRALEHTVIGHGKCARTAADGRNWHAWQNGEIVGEVRCSVR